jgi:uncharacterized protein YbjT (DUF2867 family)
VTESDPILVIGATGMLGRPVVTSLYNQGKAIRALSRSRSDATARLPQGIEIVEGDIRDPHSLAVALKGCRAVHINLRATRRDEFISVEVDGVRAIVAAAEKAGIARLSYLSAAGIESADPKLLPVQAKQLAEAAIMSSSVPYTIFRATHFMESLDLFVRGKKAVIIGQQPIPFHYLAAKDYARMVTRALNTAEAVNQAFTILGPEPFTMREALKKYITIARPDLSLTSLPLWFFKLLSRLTGKADMLHVATLFDAFRQIPEAGNTEPANRILGAPDTRLEDWCKERRPRI